MFFRFVYLPKRRFFSQKNADSHASLPHTFLVLRLPRFFCENPLKERFAVSSPLGIPKPPHIVALTRIKASAEIMLLKFRIAFLWQHDSFIYDVLLRSSRIINWCFAICDRELQRDFVFMLHLIIRSEFVFAVE